MSAALLVLLLVGAPAADPRGTPDVVTGAPTPEVPAQPGDDATLPEPANETPPPATPEPTAEPAPQAAPTPEAVTTTAPPPEAGADLSPSPAPTPLPTYAVALAVVASPTPGEGVPWAWGPALEGRWLAPAPYFLTAVVGMNRSWSANDSWEFSRTGITALGMLGIATSRGVGRLSAAVGLGAEVILEHKLRQDSSRLVGIDQGKAGWRWSAGPFATLELGAGVSFWGPLSFEVAAGPSVSLHKVAGARQAAVGLHSRMGLVYVF